MKRFAKTVVKVLTAYADLLKNDFPNHLRDERTVRQSLCRKLGLQIRNQIILTSPNPSLSFSQICAQKESNKNLGLKIEIASYLKFFFFYINILEPDPNPFFFYKDIDRQTQKLFYFLRQQKFDIVDYL